MSPEQIEKILGRPSSPCNVEWTAFAGKRILVTGGKGSIGTRLVEVLRDAGAHVAITDIGTLNVRLVDQVIEWVLSELPEIIFHLAGQKYAPEGEGNPGSTYRTNIEGTENVVEAAGLCDANVVMTSTCKAIEPETVYGATKLVAERMVLNYGGTVARLYNVVPAAGNVFETWAAMDDPVPVTDCSRYFISLDEAVHLVARCALAGWGRYTVNPGKPRRMIEVAKDLGRDVSFMPSRRGDRLIEPLKGGNEVSVRVGGGLLQVHNPHDSLRARELAA